MSWITCRILGLIMLGGVTWIVLQCLICKMRSFIFQSYRRASSVTLWFSSNHHTRPMFQLRLVAKHKMLSMLSIFQYYGRGSSVSLHLSSKNQMWPTLLFVTLFRFIVRFNVLSTALSVFDIVLPKEMCKRK